MTHRVRITDPLAELTDLTGRRAVITGGGGGLGLATARGLARQGADVLLGVRNSERAEAARRELTESENLRDDQVQVSHLDLLDLASVERFATEASQQPLSLLVLNAGISSGGFRLSTQSVESQFATNHLGHFALAGRLLPTLERGTDPRIVTVSSGLYASGLKKGATFTLDDLSREEGYSPGRAYSRSKLANTVFAVELGRRLRAAGSPVRSFTAHPGMARTPLHSTYPSRATRILTAIVAQAIGRVPEAAAVGVLAAAASSSPHMNPDLFWGPAGSKKTPVALGVPFASIAAETVIGQDLWSISTTLTGIGFLMSSRNR